MIRQAKVAWSGIRLAGALLLALAMGCSSSEPVTTLNAGGLQQVATAYQQALVKTGRPPKDAKELTAYLPAGTNLDTLLVSPNDGQPYVIVWGTDPRGAMDVSPLVIGYEKTGKNGTRFVFTAVGVMQMSDADFTKAKFPSGHKPS